MTRKARSIAIALIGGVLLPMLVRQGAAQSARPTSHYLSLNQVWPSLQPILAASGQRLLQPGKERIIVSGTISIDQGSPAAVQVVWELPQKIRIDSSAGSLVYNGQNASQSAPQEKQSSDELESLLEDSTQGFFQNHLSSSNRFLGSGFHDKSLGPKGPTFEIMEVWTHSKFHGSQPITVKRYWFDMRTKLLARVTYRTSANPGSPAVEVLLSDWRNVQGEAIPFSVERKEGGTTTMLLKLSAAAVSPMANDGTFAGSGR